MVTPLARRRPQIVTKHLTTLDSLSQGRAVIGVGLCGDVNDFTLFGETSDVKVRAAKLDESLELIRKYLGNEPVFHEGKYYRVQGADVSPGPIQRTGIHTYVGGNSRAAIRRSAELNG